MTVKLCAFIMANLWIWITIVFAQVMFKAHCRDISVETAIDNSTDSYIAAIFEYSTLIPLAFSWGDINENLDKYERAVKIAAKKDANIIVFPEDGIMGLHNNRYLIYPFLQVVPKDEKSLNPCEGDSSEQGRNSIQHRLSCMAKKHDIYIVANYGTIENCKSRLKCPPDGRFQYNTNVVFDNKGFIVSVYRKWNLYYEHVFDFPAGPEISTFITPFGTFATITCFDILFKEPAVELVETHGVTNILLPTAWQSILPEMSGLGFHESWARRMGVNLVTSELHIPTEDFVGSLIASGDDGAILYSNKYWYNSPFSLLIASVPQVPKEVNDTDIDVLNDPHDTFVTFEAEMEGNNFTFVLLENDTGIVYLNTSTTRCLLEYEFNYRIENETFAFGIFSGLHESILNSSIEVCAFVKCATSNKLACGMPTREVESNFSRLEVTGEFTTSYIYPSVLENEGNLSKAWQIDLDRDNHRAIINMTDAPPVLSAILLSRNYDQDNNTRMPNYHSLKPTLMQSGQPLTNHETVDKPPKDSEYTDYDGKNTNQGIGSDINFVLPLALLVSAVIALSIYIAHVHRGEKARRRGYLPLK